MEFNRSDASVSRFFVSLDAFIAFMCVYNKDSNKIDEAYSAFKMHMDLTIAAFKILKPHPLSSDLFFFSIHMDNEYVIGHFILVVFNMVQNSIDVIDNHITPSILESNKYYHIVRLLKYVVIRYLGDNSGRNCDYIAKFKINYLKMSWRTSNNVTDRGMFVLCHMETYFGFSYWDCGLTAKSLNLLRTRYCSVILKMKENTIYSSLKEKIINFAEDGSFSKSESP